MMAMPHLKTWDEVRANDMRAIEQETAVKWAGRAVAAWSLYGTTGELKYRDAAVEYASEAVEHAAQSGDDKVLSDVRYSIDLAREQALERRPARAVPER
jgi:hypothetical protein